VSVSHHLGACGRAPDPDDESPGYASRRHGARIRLPRTWPVSMATLPFAVSCIGNVYGTVRPSRCSGGHLDRVKMLLSIVTDDTNLGPSAYVFDR
jgi:hypothetical protein